MGSFGIIYATNSKMPRRIIAGSNNLDAHIGVGESLLKVVQASAPNMLEALAHIETATGVKPDMTPCAIVDEAGTIKNIIMADPAIDVVDAHTLVPVYEGVTPDCTYDAATKLFTAPIVVVKKGTLLKDGTKTTVATQSGGVLARPVELVPDETKTTVASQSGGVLARPVG